MAYDAASGQLILFGGGAQNAVYFNDTWTWNGSNWVQLHPATSPPFGFASSMAYDPGAIADDRRAEHRAHHACGAGADSRGRLLVSNLYGQSVTGYVNAPPYGDTFPTFRILGAPAQLNSPEGLDVDAGDDLYVADEFGGVNEYLPGKTAPFAILSGTATGLRSPRSPRRPGSSRERCPQPRAAAVAAIRGSRSPAPASPPPEGGRSCASDASPLRESAAARTSPARPELPRTTVAGSPSPSASPA